MKKLFAFITMAALLLSGCAVSDGGEAAGDRPQIVVTNYPAYDFARQVFGEDGKDADITLLLKPGTESHTYDPSAKDIVKINSCDLFIYNGGESDRWVSSILDGVDDINTLRMMDIVEVHEEEYVEGMEHSHEHDAECTDEVHEEHSEEYDEHIWTSPKNAAAIVDAVREKAIELYESNADIYNANADAYIALINDLDVRFTELLSDEDRYFVFGDRFPLLYFFKEYGLNYYAAFPGCGSNVEPSAQTISFLLEKLSGDDVVKTVFYIELSDKRIADTLATDTGLPTAEFHACHNITADDFAAGETYVSLMDKNYKNLKIALE